MESGHDRLQLQVRVCLARVLDIEVEPAKPTVQQQLIQVAGILAASTYSTCLPQVRKCTEMVEVGGLGQCEARKGVDKNPPFAILESLLGEKAHLRGPIIFTLYKAMPALNGLCLCLK